MIGRLAASRAGISDCAGFVSNHLDSAYQRSTASRDDVLTEAAKRHRVDAEKLQKVVAEELAAKQDKKNEAKAKPKSRKTTA